MKTELCGRPDPKLVVIIGATGTGKSKLAIDLCRRFDGEVVSADSMQIYEGLDVVTCKVTRAEMQGVPHHMMSFLNPSTIGYTVVDFRDGALKTIDDILARGKVPVIVGGTFYYVESLIWSNLFGTNSSGELQNEQGRVAPFYADLPEAMLSMSDEQLHAELKAVDPERASHLHPGNRRRVVRSLQVWHSSHKTHTELLKEQHEAKGADRFGGAARFHQVCILWLRCETQVLDERLRHRSQSMVGNGLREELASFFDDHYQSIVEKVKQLPESDTEHKGVFQCIGLKQFSDFLHLPPEARNSSEGDAAFSKGLEALLIATRQYAKKQLKWIKNRFLKRPLDAGFRLYALDATLADKYDNTVLNPAIDIVRSFLYGLPSTAQPLQRDQIEAVHTDEANLHRLCEVCNRLIAQSQWQTHVTSKSHRKQTKKLKRSRSTIDSEKAIS